MPRIVSENRVTSRVTALDIHAPEIAGGAEAGQIVLTRFDQDSPWLPKALSGVDREKGLLTVLSRDESRPGGHRGRALRSLRPVEDSPTSGQSSFRRGGTGDRSDRCPSSQRCKEKGCYTMVIAGFSSKNDVFWIERLNESERRALRRHRRRELRDQGSHPPHVARGVRTDRRHRTRSTPRAP